MEAESGTFACDKEKGAPGDSEGRRANTEVPVINLPPGNEGSSSQAGGDQQPRLSDKRRRKKPLKPGFGLGDWLKLDKENKDLSGTGGGLSVSLEELSKHNTENDIWISIGINVFNVTPYLDFHPGGREELMKAAGGDATALFNSVHPWVNYNYFLRKCKVGILSV
eukprot:Nk52_evm89s207 gene=Nk52_evmTU89s207